MVDFAAIRLANAAAKHARETVSTYFAPKAEEKKIEPTLTTIESLPRIDVAMYIWDECELNPWEKMFIPSIINWLLRDSANTLSAKQVAKLLEMAKSLRLHEDINEGFLFAGYSDGIPSPVLSSPAEKQSALPKSSGDPRDAVQQNHAPKIDKFGFDDMDDDIPF